MCLVVFLFLGKKFQNQVFSVHGWGKFQRLPADYGDALYLKA